MCLGVPGKVLSIADDPFGMPMGKVSFAGITKEVCMAYTPEAEVGDYVVVHVGFAISKIDEALLRMEDGTYGVCEECGDDIGVDRLKARPVTTLCVRCKSEQEAAERRRHA